MKLKDLKRSADSAYAACQKRMEESKDPSIRLLRPAELDWATEEEKAAIDTYTLARGTYLARERLAAQKRVAKKRAARVTAMESVQDPT